ncbi:NUDIX domain-containing protein [Pontibacter sp. G13]|uniref:NUDIX hydrolase n=1 Tax=Pontibacter sp. G13 TaxID=3074898 RepID=UPI00288C05FF|nr:NUDIX domain-containing protein [Pontibacter sp. G13]WNJ19797.1 NUDIX domain-containing protein [Pontibacter sp. G13]
MSFGLQTPQSPIQFPTHPWQHLEALLSEPPANWSGRQWYVRADDSEACISSLFQTVLRGHETRAKGTIEFQFDEVESLEKAIMQLRKLFKVKVAAGGLVHNEEGAFLMISHRNVWTLPKGHVEKEEPVELAAVREVQEETGLQQVEMIGPLIVTYHTYFEKKKWVLKETHWYRMTADKSQALIPQLEESISEVAWKSKAEWIELSPYSFPLNRQIFEAEFAAQIDS